jgi:Ras family protein T1
LNDVELNNFQTYCFDVPLQPNVLDEVKAIVRRNISDGVVNNGLALRGIPTHICAY